MPSFWRTEPYEQPQTRDFPGGSHRHHWSSWSTSIHSDGFEAPLSHDQADSLDQALAEAVAEFYSDPLGFVMFAYPWVNARVTTTMLTMIQSPSVCGSVPRRSRHRLQNAQPYATRHVTLEMFRPHEARSFRVTCVVSFPAHWAASREPLGVSRRCLSRPEPHL